MNPRMSDWHVHIETQLRSIRMVLELDYNISVLSSSVRTKQDKKSYSKINRYRGVRPIFWIYAGRQSVVAINCSGLFGSAT